MTTDLILMIVMMFAAMWTVMCRSLLKATIGLAVTSAVLSIIIFRMNAPITAVFELSVCSGLITAVFVITISLTKPLTNKEIIELSKDRIKRFIYLPLVILLLGGAFYALYRMNVNNIIYISKIEQVVTDVKTVLWDSRQLDLFGQIIILIAGAIGVVTLFEEKEKDEW